MNQVNKVIKYLAIAFGLFLVFNIVSGIMYGFISIGNIFSDDLSKILSGERAEQMRMGFQCRKATEELCRKCGYARRF